MPFDELSSAGDWERPAVWQQHEYDSESAGKRCDDETYRSISETAWAMEWTTFRQYCYLHMDLALADVMETFRSEFFDRFGLDPLQYITLPSAAKRWSLPTASSTTEFGGASWAVSAASSSSMRKRTTRG